MLNVKYPNQTIIIVAHFQANISFSLPDTLLLATPFPCGNFVNKLKTDQVPQNGYHRSIFDC